MWMCKKNLLFSKTLIEPYLVCLIKIITNSNFCSPNNTLRIKNILNKFVYLLTLIRRTPYRFSYQPTCMPFPLAQCEYHIWIRSAGNVSISFFPLKGNRGRGVHCEGVQRKAGAEGGSSGSILPERCVLLRSFYTFFAQKQCKRTTFAFY